MYGVQDCIIFRHSDIQGVAERRAVSWLPKKDLIDSYLALIATHFCPSQHPDPAASWAPLALLPNPPEALLFMSGSLQRAMFSFVASSQIESKKTKSKTTRSSTATLALTVSRTIVHYCNLTLAEWHLRTCHALKRTSKAARATALALLDPEASLKLEARSQSQASKLTRSVCIELMLCVLFAEHRK
jgi:hypothetical protein